MGVASHVLLLQLIHNKELLPTSQIRYCQLKVTEDLNGNMGLINDQVVDKTSNHLVVALPAA